MAPRDAARRDEEQRRLAASDERAPTLLSRLRGALFRRRSDDRRPSNLEVGGVRLGPGDRVRLRPSGRRDVFDLALTGRKATIVSIEQDHEDRVYFSVTLDDDPGRDLGAQRKPGRRFLFDPEEVEPEAGSGGGGERL